MAQLRRAASSVGANIVEGHARSSRRDFAHFLTVARGSLEELKYFLILSRDLKYFSTEDYNEVALKCDEVGRMLYVFRQKLTL